MNINDTFCGPFSIYRRETIVITDTWTQMCLMNVLRLFQDCIVVICSEFTT